MLNTYHNNCWKSCRHCLSWLCLAFVLRLGQPLCCPLFEIKNAHSAKELTMQLLQKSQYVRKIVARANIKKDKSVVE